MKQISSVVLGLAIGISIYMFKVCEKTYLLIIGYIVLGLLVFGANEIITSMESPIQLLNISFGYARLNTLAVYGIIIVLTIAKVIQNRISIEKLNKLFNKEQ